MKFDQMMRAALACRNCETSACERRLAGRRWHTAVAGQDVIRPDFRSSPVPGRDTTSGGLLGQLRQPLRGTSAAVRCRRPPAPRYCDPDRSGSTLRLRDKPEPSAAFKTFFDLGQRGRQIGAAVGQLRLSISSQKIAGLEGRRSDDHAGRLGHQDQREAVALAGFLRRSARPVAWRRSKRLLSVGL